MSVLRIYTEADDGTVTPGEFATRFVAHIDRPTVIGFIGLCEDIDSFGMVSAPIAGTHKENVIQIKLGDQDSGWITVREGFVIDPKEPSDLYIRIEQQEHGLIEFWTDVGGSYAH